MVYHRNQVIRRRGNWHLFESQNFPAELFPHPVISHVHMCHVQKGKLWVVLWFRFCFVRVHMRLPIVSWVKGQELGVRTV